MSKIMDLLIPCDSSKGWRENYTRAKEIYWGERKGGKNENDALSAVIDDILSRFEK